MTKNLQSHFSEDTRVLAQLGGSTCPQMSSEELSLGLSSLFWFCGFAVVGSAISISDSILICLWIVRWRSKWEEKLHQRVVFHFHTIASSEALVFILVYYIPNTQQARWCLFDRGGKFNMGFPDGNGGSGTSPSPISSIKIATLLLLWGEEIHYWFLLILPTPIQALLAQLVTRCWSTLIFVETKTLEDLSSAFEDPGGNSACLKIFHQWVFPDMIFVKSFTLCGAFDKYHAWVFLISANRQQLSQL